MKRLLVISISFIAFSVITVEAKENRCGWYENPSPGNLWLVDSKGTWILSTQGDSGSKLTEKDFKKLPKFPKSQYITTQASYGYGCVCMIVDTDGDQNIVKIYKSRSLRLSSCLLDKNLPQSQGKYEMP
jgi:hypothetical protein